MYDDDELAALVVNNGSGMLKAGLAGQHYPQVQRERKMYHWNVQYEQVNHIGKYYVVDLYEKKDIMMT